MGTGITDTATLNVNLTDTMEVIDGDTTSFYYAPVHIVPGGFYFVSVSKEGYPFAVANVSVPSSSTMILDQSAYSILRNLNGVNSEIDYEVNVSSLTSAAFAQLLIEYRGIDSAGNFHIGSFNVTLIDSVNPFIEIQAPTIPVSLDTALYNRMFNLAKQSATRLKNYHMYADIIVTQVDDNFYRYFVTSNHSLDPLSMRTDKIIFSNIFYNAGTGIVAGVSVDTTRIFLF